MFYVIEFEDGEVDFIERNDYSEALHFADYDGREYTISEYASEEDYFHSV